MQPEPQQEPKLEAPASQGATSSHGVLTPEGTTISQQGQERYSQLNGQFEKALMDAAASVMKLHGSTNLDESDFNRAYDNLIQPHRLGLLGNCAASGVVAVGALASGYGINLLTDDGKEGAGWLLVLSGVMLVVVGEAARHLAARKG